MAVRLLFAEGTAADWAASTLVLAVGQPGWDSTNRLLKVGDGGSLWADLPAYAPGSTGSSYTDEQVRDVVAAMIASGTQTGITVTYDDATDKLSFSVAATGGGAPLASPSFTGNPTAPTPSFGDNDTSIATTAFVQAVFAAFTNYPVSSVAGKTGVVTLVKADVSLGNVDNTSDVNKPVSTAQAAAILLAQSSLVGINSQSGTSYTPVLGDAGKLIVMTSASANTLTIPPNSSVGYPIGTTLPVASTGAGVTTIAAGSGVTLVAPDGARLTTAGRQAAPVKIATDTWLLAGATVV